MPGWLETIPDPRNRTPLFVLILAYFVVIRPYDEAEGRGARLDDP